MLYSTLCKLERLAWKAADHVVTVNRSLADTVIERGSKPATALTIVMNGPPWDRTATARPTLKQGRSFLVVWFGAMGPQDHVDLALRAAEHIVKEFGRDDIHFALIGDGESEPALRQLSRELGLDEFVTFTGFLREPEYLEYLATADLGWDTNLQEEVTPVKGMEYLSFGLPMVSFDLRETAAMARDAAEYAPPGDAAALAKLAVELLDDQPRRARLGAIGRARICDELAWEHQEERYLAAIDAQAGRSRRRDAR
jgi:glycosyltransferase involved in cell wall biosynthesis